jgi:hypothetical protein
MRIATPVLDCRRINQALMRADSKTFARTDFARMESFIGATEKPAVPLREIK